jgi:hypothetical protein
VESDEGTAGHMDVGKHRDTPEHVVTLSLDDGTKVLEGSTRTLCGDVMGLGRSE